jgi:Cu(I)/Ag(I) efflux system protein CusF
VLTAGVEQFDFSKEFQMKRMLIAAIAGFTFISFVSPAIANEEHHQKTEAQKTYSGKGEVIVVDMAAGKIKLKHEAIPELDWPAMTMFIPVSDKSKLDGLKVGDKIEFQFVKSPGSSPLITEIKTLK